MNNLSIPIAAVPRVLGAGTAIPFLLLAALSWVHGPYQPPSEFILLACGVVILSLSHVVGAPHWAFTMVAEGLTEWEHNRHCLWSVVPALLGWTALLAALATVLA